MWPSYAHLVSGTQGEVKFSKNQLWFYLLRGETEGFGFEVLKKVRTADELQFFYSLVKTCWSISSEKSVCICAQLHTNWNCFWHLVKGNKQRIWGGTAFQRETKDQASFCFHFPPKELVKHEPAFRGLLSCPNSLFRLRPSHPNLWAFRSKRQLGHLCRTDLHWNGKSLCKRHDPILHARL